MKIKTSVRKKPEENVIPLINVVFLMLAFFLIAGTLKSISNREIEPASVKDKEKHYFKSVHMYIDADGTISLNGQKIQSENLTQYLKQTIFKANRGKPFYIAADKNLEAASFVKILEIVNEAGIGNAHIVAVRKGRE